MHTKRFLKESEREKKKKKITFYLFGSHYQKYYLKIKKSHANET